MVKWVRSNRPGIFGLHRLFLVCFRLTIRFLAYVIIVALSGIVGHYPHFVLDFWEVEHMIALDIFVLKEKLSGQLVVDDDLVEEAFVDFLVQVDGFDHGHVLVVVDQLLDVLGVHGHAPGKGDLPLRVFVPHADRDDVVVDVLLVVEVSDASRAILVAHHSDLGMLLFDIPIDLDSELFLCKQCFCPLKITERQLWGRCIRKADFHIHHLHDFVVDNLSLGVGG